MKRPRLLALALLSALVTAGSALGAQPSRRDRADALAYYSAARSFAAALVPAIANVPSQVDRQAAGCPHSFTGASAAEIQEAKAAASDLEVFRAIIPRYSRFARAVEARHATSAVLKRVASAAIVINRGMQKYTTVHGSVCTLGSDWQADAWADGFTDTWMHQLDQRAGADQRAMTAAERRIAGSKMQLQTLGLSARQAGDLVGIASLG